MKYNMKYIAIFLSFVCASLGVYIYYHDKDIDVIDIDGKVYNEQYTGEYADVPNAANDTLRVQSLRVYDGIKTNKLELSGDIYEGDAVPIYYRSATTYSIEKGNLRMYRFLNFVYLGGSMSVVPFSNINAGGYLALAQISTTALRPVVNAYTNATLGGISEASSATANLSIETNGILYLWVRNNTLTATVSYTFTFNTIYRIL